LSSTKFDKGKKFKKTSNPKRHKTINNPTGRLIKNDLDDGFLNDFIPENMMIWISVGLISISLVLAYLYLGVPGLFFGFISTLVFVFLNTVFFIKITNWLCGRYVIQRAAFSTIIFSSSISSIPNDLLTLVGIQTGSWIYIIISLITQSIIFELRLKEGFGKSFGIAFFYIFIKFNYSFLFGLYNSRSSRRNTRAKDYGRISSHITRPEDMAGIASTRSVRHGRCNPCWMATSNSLKHKRRARSGSRN